jgi:predicted ATPase
VVTHSEPLIAGLDAHAEAQVIRFGKELGATRVEGQSALTTPRWQWPKR